MADDLTVPCGGIGAWEGARVLAAQSGPLRAARGLVSGIGRHVDGVDSAWIYGEPHRRLVADLRLDLTHRPTRLEAIERWRRVTPRATGGIGEPWFGRMHRPNVRYLACGDLHAVAHPVGRPSYLAYAVVVPTLADLDPTDDTRLPDGARVVDVRALAVVVAHVFGAAR